MSINFKDKQVPYFIGEIGINANSDLTIIKKLIDAAYACEWDSIKMQKRNPDKSTPEHQKNVMRSTPWGDMKYIDYKYKMEFSRRDYNYIDKYCREKPLDWSASVWDLDSLEFLSQYDLPYIKIPSAFLTNDELIIEVYKTNNTIILSTGMSELEEIDRAVNLYHKQSNKNDLVLLHCNSSYPAKVSELNLKMIPTLQNRYGGIIGYSGHEKNLEPTVIAVSLGAKVIERHITISHNLWGTDQSASLEVHAMDMLRKRCIEAVECLGDGIKRVTEDEKKVRLKLRGQ